MIELPRAFLTKMEQLLGDEFAPFMASYEHERLYGLRLNRLKLNADEWRAITPFGSDLRRVPWNGDGYYYKEDMRPGKHPFYHAGLYYIQEPSAMAPVELLDVQPGHRVLDLCAAPGGKSTQIAGKLQGRGVLVSNDNASERTKALAKNIELAGVRNAVVLNAEPSALIPAFRGWFDRILIDAPCSGEGMFRKDDSMIAGWEKHSVERCSVMQRDILRDAALLLAPGGVIVYSTCTFSPEENEAQIAAFLAANPHFELLPSEHDFGWRPGNPDWAGEAKDELDAERLASIAGTVRLWPHLLEGEGHYAAVLRKREDSGEAKPPAEMEERTVETKALSVSDNDRSRSRGKKDRLALQAGEKRHAGKAGGNLKGRGASRPVERTEDAAASWLQFAQANLTGSGWDEGKIVAFGSRVYLQPQELPSLDGVRVVRAGWYVGEAERGRFEPSQALAMGLQKQWAKRSIRFSSEDPAVIRYLKGETLFVEPEAVELVEGDSDRNKAALRGYVLVCVEGYPLGWGKYSDGGMLKNELPAGWRYV
ncbi:RsmB/NOP family class I SAM-dependent RNA methyltransferase [Paenibacillus sp. NPDC058071]|uniref:RsmB/NOP family class I SAM-dependent RNA methyltransferase n=1 Tax=Paenibacillus sp. NPDC058071 TaxID=3346326 RepID=UPI0036D786A9